MKENEVQELYNKLLLKREWCNKDVVARLSIEEVTMLLNGLKLLGASEKLGIKAVEDFKYNIE